MQKTPHRQNVQTAIYCPKPTGLQGFSSMRCMAERAVKNARSLSEKSGVQHEAIILAPENFFAFSFSITKSAADREARMMLERLPRDIPLVLAFSVFLTNRRQPQNTGYIVSQEGIASQPKRTFATGDASRVAEYCEARPGGKSAKHYKQAWHAREEKLMEKGEPFLSFTSGSGQRFSYMVCLDVHSKSVGFDPHAIALVSADGLGLEQVLCLSLLRKGVIANDGLNGTRLAPFNLEERIKASRGALFDRLLLDEKWARANE